MKSHITVEIIIETAAKLSNHVGLENLTLKMVADELKIKSPSLYNHISCLDEMKRLLMIYGWKNLETKMIDAAIGVAGYQALRNMCWAFYDYAIHNKGVFNAMLWYNKYDNEEANQATQKLFDVLLKVMRPLNLSDDHINHSIRTLRSFLEGFALLVNNNAFGNPLSIQESFELSLTIIMNGIKSLEGEKENE